MFFAARLQQLKSLHGNHAGFFASTRIRASGSTFPATAIETPAVRILMPAWWGIAMVATAYALPVTADPDVAMAIPCPVTRRPHVAATWRWRAFITWWWRWRADADIHRGACLRLCCRRHQHCRCSARGQQDCQDNILVGHDVLPCF